MRSWQSDQPTSLTAANARQTILPAQNYPYPGCWSFCSLLSSQALFGYDQGVISGALLGIQKQFTVSALVLEVITSWVTLGALFGSLAGGYLADHYGRRKAVLSASILFTAGAVIEAYAPNVPLLVVGRLIVGFGVGNAAVAAPLYAAELAPATYRGRFVSSYQLAITIGIFLAYFVDAMLAGASGWRLMLGLSAVPGILLFMSVLPAPESTRWLMRMGRRDDARRTLRRIRPDVDPEVRLKAIQASLASEMDKASWREVFAHRWRGPLRVGLGLSILQQVTGINAIIYYSDRIFAAAGFTTADARTQATTWAIGAVNVMATFIAIAFIDRIGRRPLLLTGLVGMGMRLIAVGFAFLQLHTLTSSTDTMTAGIVTLVALVVFIISFAFSLGPVTWTVINEIYPGFIRGRAVAVATAMNWGAAFIVSEFFLTLVNAIGETATFWMFAVFCGLGMIWVYLKVPETNGHSLEQIEAYWTASADQRS